MPQNFADAQQAALGFMIRQTKHIEAAVNEIVYPDIQYPAIVPIDTSANPWVKSVTYFSSDKAGRADWINGNADDIPKATTSREKFETLVHTAAIGYGFNFEEVNQATMLGINLQNEDAMAARRAYEEMVDRVALFGDTAKNFTGLLNASTVPSGSATNGDWPTKTGDQILTDINNALIGQFSATLWTSIADTLLLPYERFLLIASKPRSADSDETVLSFLQRSNVYTAQTGRPLTIRAIRGMTTLGSGNTMRMVAYRRDPAVVKMHIPMMHRFLPVWQSGPLRFDVPGIFRLGGVDWRRPKEGNYVDGI